jgi:hypothetical protein
LSNAVDETRRRRLCKLLPWGPNWTSALIFGNDRTPARPSPGIVFVFALLMLPQAASELRDLLWS